MTAEKVTLDVGVVTVLQVILVTLQWLGVLVCLVSNDIKVTARFFKVDFMGVARGKSGWGSFPKDRRPRAGCGAEPHVAPQAKIFWVLDGGGIPRI